MHATGPSARQFVIYKETLMSIVLIDKLLDPFISAGDMTDISAKVKDAHAEIKKRYEKNFIPGLEKKDRTPLGWWKLPDNYDKEEFLRIKQTALKIKKLCDIFIVLGIGGSYLGARAAIEYIKSPNYNVLSKDTPDVYFTGNSISATAIDELIGLCRDKNVCINVISKSGETTETALAFRIFRSMLEHKYGVSGAKERIFVTTGADPDRTLRKMSEINQYETFTVPDDIGGRYSVLTSVGLLPIAVAGIDIDALMTGAKTAMHELAGGSIDTNPCLRYAAVRNILYDIKKKDIEIFACYDPALTVFGEWWKQLYGESEGKNNRGLFPASVTYSTDLHSLGQIIQQGRRIMFETVISIKNPSVDLTIEKENDSSDGMNYLAGKSMDKINKTAMLATALAHTDGDVPNIIIEIKDRSAASFGYMVYFFELACAISGYMLGINPFDQPGVEGYKNNMYGLLGKPDKDGTDKYAGLRNKLENRLKNMILDKIAGKPNIYDYFL